MLSAEDLEIKLTTDPNYLVNFIIDNNKEEVINRMVQLGFGDDVVTKEDVLIAVNHLLETNDFDNLRFALSVPLRSERIPEYYYAAIERATDKAFSNGNMGNMPMPI